ncbi:hypothetical protein [Mucilaginibacter jinjuensis]|uniref:DUF3828 domain-containing protein n=1 Tax=Mucilaginibacter jinjuensis TaxID=1176721 RepID=A0ABY7T923_9SPHI|nr:hypothetical protein [Mucilaginibacter jinjuensis]WCT12733.1 hypothetical protein PQO05_02150 [Mucilaginibacter jinjuensis]
MVFKAVIKRFLKHGGQYVIVGCAALFLMSITLKRQSKPDTDPEAILMLKSFYTAYMSAFSIKDAHKGEQVMLELRAKYLTANAQKDYVHIGDEQDMDAIVNGQDSDEKWTKSLVFKNDQENSNVYYVSYSSPDLDKKHKEYLRLTTIMLLLTKEDGQYKIDHLLYPAD